MTDAVSGIGTSADVITIGNSVGAPAGDVAEGDVGDEGALVVSLDEQAVRVMSAAATRATVLARELTPGLSPAVDLLLPMLRRNDSDSVSGEASRRAPMFRPCESCAARRPASQWPPCS